MEHATVMKKYTTQDTAFEALYEAQADRVTRYITARVGMRQVADDLTAQTFLKALEAMRRGKGGRNLTAWLFGIARHVVADYYRQRKPELPLEDAESASEVVAIGDTVERKLRLEQVASALKMLSPPRAEALALRIFGGLTTAEAARVMGRTPRAVKMLVYRGTQDLQNLFETKEGE